MHIKKVINNGRKRVNQLYSTISNGDINLHIGYCFFL